MNETPEPVALSNRPATVPTIASDKPPTFSPPHKVWDIHGGVHPDENKSQSLSQPITALGIPPVLVLPLSQHIGAPAKPIVAVGDTVLKGQCIAEAVGPVSVPIHASSSGTVTAIEPRPIPHTTNVNNTTGST